MRQVLKDNSYVLLVDTDEEKLSIVNRLREEGLAGILFYDREYATDEDWLSQWGKHRAWVMQPYDEHTLEPMGVAWFDNIHGKTAESHFCLYKKYQSHAQAHRAGLLVLNFVTKALKVKLLTGITPKPYRQSHKMMKGWGFKAMMTMPEACYLAKYNKHYDGIFYVRVS